MKIICLEHYLGGQEYSTTHLVVSDDFNIKEFEKHKRNWEKWNDEVYIPGNKKVDKIYSRLCSENKYAEALALKWDVPWISLDEWIISNSNARRPMNDELEIFEYD